MSLAEVFKAAPCDERSEGIKPEIESSTAIEYPQQRQGCRIVGVGYVSE
jgi:hypothetical protein